MGESEKLDDTDRRLLAAIGAGASGVEAGEALGLSLSVVADRLRRIRSRLGVNSTAAAVKMIERE